MRKRAIPANFDAAVVETIDQRLRDLSIDEKVAIPLAIESGSRAWGFPSPDSDYDCRFIYVRTEDDYLSPWLKADVLETPLDAVLDVNGWDLRKAVQLLLKGNAVVGEWLRSPIAYGVDETFRRSFLALCDRVADRNAVGRHYQHVGLGQWERYAGSNPDDVPLKRLFYALRPALAVRWLRLHDHASVPPMDVSTLMDEAEIVGSARSAIDDLIALKGITKEMGSGTPTPPILELIDLELRQADGLFDVVGLLDPSEARAEASEFFRDVVRANSSGTS